MNRSVIIFIVLFCVAISTVFADGVSVHLSQRKVGLNDSFSVTFATSQNIKEPPDFTPLKNDFDILSTSHDNSISIINGQMSQEIRWHVALMGKQEGNLVIPSIRFGEYSSSPQAIEITKSIAVKQEEPIFLETELSPKETVYEQSLLTYTVRLYCSVKLAQAALSEVSLNDKDAMVERLGNDVEYDHYDKNGKHYRVYERKYAVFPQHAGELVFAPLQFEGAVISGGNVFFDMPTTVKRLQSEKESITVKSIPPSFHKSNWLAANDVQLTEEWSQNLNKLVLGEPITWTIKLTAAGCMGNHIPDITVDFPNDLKHYFDKAEPSNQITADGIIGTKQIKIALIPTKSGKIELPKIDVAWWDLRAAAVRHAELPARTLEIKNSNIALKASTIAAPKDVAPVPVDTEVNQNIDRSLWSFWWVWGIFGLAFFLLIALILVIRKVKKANAPQAASLKRLRNALKKACKEGSAKHAEAALLAWFAQKTPSSKHLNLLAIKHIGDEEFQKRIQELYQALYSQNTAWNGEALWKAFCKYKPQKESSSKTKGSLLPDLYT